MYEHFKRTIHVTNIILFIIKGRAKIRIEKLERLLELAKSDYKQLDGPIEKEEKQRIDALNELGRYVFFPKVYLI